MAAPKYNSGSDNLEAEVQLIAMRKDDSSWHPCKISLCSDRVGLNIQYMINGSTDVILTKEEALARLLVCPAPLEGAECTLIGQGDRILANPKSQAKDIFFEAEVEKRINARHLKKRCTCSFVVKWNCHAFRGETAILPISAIMKMPVSCIDVHPTIAAFFSTLAIPVRNYSPLSTLVEGTKLGEMDVSKPDTEGSDCEMDDFKLEKQIEDISHSAAACNIQADQHKWQAPYNSTSAHSSISPSPFLIGMNEEELKGSETPPVMKEEPVNTRILVNPQAAVAYLALKKSKFSGSTEGANVWKPQPSVGVEISKGGTPYNVSFISNSSHSARTEAAITKYILKNDSIVKKLFLVEEDTEDHRILGASCNASYLEECRDLKFQPEIVDDISNTAFSATNDRKKPRKRSSGISCENVEMTCLKETKSIPLSAKTRRLTRSVIRKAEANTINGEKPSPFQDRNLLEEEEAVVSVNDAETTPTFIKNLKGQGGNMELCDEKDPEKKASLLGMKTSNITRRMTRSAVHRQTENCDVKRYQKSEANRLSQILEGSITSESKVQTSAPAKIMQKTEGHAPRNHACGERVKRKLFCHKKQQLRKSPRLLGFLPRTRSQVKS